MVINNIKISVASQNKSLFLIPPKIFCIRPPCEGSVFHSSLLLWGVGLYMCFQTHSLWTIAGHTEFLPCLGLELTYVLPIHNLLARTNHMAPPIAENPRIAVLHEVQITDEHVTLPSKHLIILHLAYNNTSVSPMIYRMQSIVHSPLHHAFAPSPSDVVHADEDLPDMFFLLLHIVNMQWCSG